MKRLLVFLIIIELGLSVKSQEFWQPSNCLQFNIKSYDMSENSTLYISAEDIINQVYGIFKSQDEGETWKLIYEIDNGQLPNFLTCSNESILFDNNNGEVLRSIDEGLSWNVVYINSSITSITSSESGNIYIGSDILIRSIDNCQTWDTIYEVTPQIESIEAVLEISIDTIIIGTIHWFGEGGVYCTYDGGDSWTKGLHGRNITCVDINSNGYIFLGGMSDFETNDCIYRSYDFGNNWESVYQNMNLNVSSIAITMEDVLYFGTSTSGGNNGGIYRSFDEGNNWEITDSEYINQGIESGKIKILTDLNLYSTPKIFGNYKLFKTHSF